MPEELRLMVCPILGTEGVETTPEWGQTACVECGRDVHLSPEARRIMREKSAMPVCGPCSVELATANGAYLADVQAVGEWSDGETKEEVVDLYRRAAEARREHDMLGQTLLERGASQEDLDRISAAADAGMDNFDALKMTAEAACRALPPNGELGSICIIENWEGDTLPPIPIGEMLGKGMPKQIIAHQLLPAMVHAAQGKRVLFGISSWIVKAKGQEIEMPESGTLADHPSAQEALVLIDVTADGVVRMASTIMTRDGFNAPQLTEWEESPEPSKSQGLFVEAIIPVLQLIRTLRGESVET